MSININEYIKEGDLLAKLKQLGLVEIITEKYEDEWGLAPTYNRGQDLIDSIFVLVNL